MYENPGGGRCPRPWSGGYLADKWGGDSIQLRTLALLNAKNFVFFLIYAVSARKRGEGETQCGHFANKEGRKSIFRNFVRTSFMDGP